MKISYNIEYAGDLPAGKPGYTDTVTIGIESGDPGGDSHGLDSFQEHMRQSLLDWYDGARVDLSEIQRSPAGECLLCEAATDAHSWKREVVELRKMLSDVHLQMKRENDYQNKLFLQVNDYFKDRGQ